MQSTNISISTFRITLFDIDVTVTHLVPVAPTSLNFKSYLSPDLRTIQLSGS